MAANLSTYPVLLSYAVLSSSGITTVQPLLINKGVYGSSATQSYTGPITGTVDNANPTTAQTQLTTFVGAINALASTATVLPTPVGGGVGVITIPAGVYDLAAAPTITASIVFSGTSTDKFYVISPSTITLNNIPSISLTGGALASNIVWLANSAFSMTGTSPSTGIFGTIIAQSTASFANGITTYGPVYAQTAAVTFGGAGNVVVNGFNTAVDIICYAKGTSLLAPKGYVPVESLHVGDLVVTAGQVRGHAYAEGPFEVKPILWVGHYSTSAVPLKSRPVCFRAGSLGLNAPSKDLYVSPGHRMMIDGVAVPARSLINGTTIVQECDSDTVTYYHVEVDTPTALVAEGVLAESFAGGMHNSNRDIFYPSARAMASFRDVTVAKPYLMGLTH